MLTQAILMAGIQRFLLRRHTSFNKRKTDDCGIIIKTECPFMADDTVFVPR